VAGSVPGGKTYPESCLFQKRMGWFFSTRFKIPTIVESHEPLKGFSEAPLKNTRLNNPLLFCHKQLAPNFIFINPGSLSAQDM
jgi:hypothetical protein